MSDDLRSYFMSHPLVSEITSDLPPADGLSKIDVTRPPHRIMPLTSSIIQSATPESNTSSPPFTKDGRIRLDVGGERTFLTTIGTLMNGSKYFKARLSGRWAIPRNEAGVFTCFVDADAETFTHVLAYLRTGRMPLFWTKADGFNVKLYSQVLDQAHFFVIPRLSEWIETSSYNKAVRITTRTHIDDDSSWNGGTKVVDTTNGSEDVVLQHHWTSWKEYVCPRFIEVHRGKPEACGKACMQAQGDDQTEYEDVPYCKLTVTTKTYTADYKALLPDASHASNVIYTNGASWPEIPKLQQPLQPLKTNGHAPVSNGSPHLGKSPFNSEDTKTFERRSTPY